MTFIFSFNFSVKLGIEPRSLLVLDESSTPTLQVSNSETRDNFCLYSRYWLDGFFDFFVRRRAV